MGISPLLSSLLCFVLAVFMIEITQKIRKENSFINVLIIGFSLVLCYMVAVETTRHPLVAVEELPKFWIAYVVFCLFIGNKNKFSRSSPNSKDSATCEKNVMNRIAEEGDIACQESIPKSSNPYKAPNAEHENPSFASYWDRGYAVAEMRKKRGNRSENVA